jgi:PAS domain S-box-containing protein
MVDRESNSDRATCRRERGADGAPERAAALDLEAPSADAVPQTPHGLWASEAGRQTQEALRQTTARLALAVRAGGVGIWDYDVVNNRLMWDDQMFRLYGITPDQFGGAYEAWQAGLHPDDRQRGDDEIQLALQGKKDFDIEFRVLWPDGTTHTIRGFASVQRNAAGQPVRMIGTNWDITATKRTEEALRENEANFRTFFETMTDMIMVGTTDGRVLFTNAAVTRLLGYTAEELREIPLLDLHPAERRQEAGEIFAAMFRGERASCPLPLVAKNGALVPVETRVWFGKWNGAECLFGIIKDLSAEQEARQLFERLFRNSPSLIALSTLPDRRFADVNDSFLKTLGYSRGDIIGKTAAEIGLFVHPERHAALTQALLVEGQVARAELQVRCRDGVLLDGLFSGEVVNSQGRQYFLTVMVDISERKRNERQLARLSVIQGELMRLATKFVSVPLERQDMAIDQSLASIGQMIHADRAYLYAYDAERGVMSNTHEWCAVGTMPMISMQRAEPVAPYPGWLEAHQRGETVYVPSVAALPPDSPLRRALEPQGVRSLITLPLMRDETCVGFVGFDAVRQERSWQDEEVLLLRLLARLYAHFGARREAERELRELQKRLTQARDEAQEAARAKTLFLANMSHEIRTPLNAILGYAQILERESGSGPKDPRLRAITRSGEHLLQLITDLLDLVRSDTRMIALAPSEFDFPQVLEDVRLMFAQQPAAPSVSLVVSCAADVPRFVYADQGKIRQVLVNLVGNALKFTEKGSVCLAASVLPGRAPGEVVLTVDVTDTGCGIRADELERIFDIFYLAESGRKAGKGTGLGLPLSRRYARVLGGDVTAASRLGEGSNFRFTFGARRAESADGERLQHRIVMRLAPGQRPWRVLAVDDDPISRSVLVAMLEPVGFVLETAAHAADALRRLRQAQGIDLVLLDKHMPDMDGYTAIGHIRNLAGGREVRVVVVTAVGFAGERALALAAGADGFVSKPVRRKTLMAEIARVTGVRYEYDEVSATVAPATPVALAPAVLARLSAEQRDGLDQALRRGDIRQLRLLVEAIAADHAEMAAGIRALVDTYDYDRLRHLLDAAKRDVV